MKVTAMPPSGYYQISTKQKNDIVAQISAFLARQSEIVFAFLYGSFLTETFFRDIDIGIYVNQMSPAEFSTYENRLAYLLAKESNFSWPMEVKIINIAPVSFDFQVMRGKLLFTQDDDLLSDLMVATARKYLDMAPLRRHYIREAMA
jgi:hypothetical protein